MEPDSFPKIAQAAIPRRAIERWFNFHRDTPLRYVFGCAGSGKSTAATLHARGAAHAVSFMQMPPEGTIKAFLATLSRTLNIVISDTADIAHGFPRDQRFELIIDDIDHGDGEVRELLTQLPINLPPMASLTYLARARSVVDMTALTLKGLGATLERSQLAFTHAEVAEFCDALNVSYATSDISQLIYSSEGWAFAVSGSIRDAAADGQNLWNALARWQDRHRRLLDELVARSVTGLLPDDVLAAQRIYAGERPSDAPSYGRLHDLGLLLSFSDAELRPLRAVTPSPSGRTRVTSGPEPALPVALSTLEMFGAFEMTIDGRKVNWIRRRDRQIVEYLALQAETVATRRDLIATFWPDSDQHLARQSLRTACSNIRRAIAQCVGYDRTHHYFTAGREVRLNTGSCSISSLRLHSHMREAEEALTQGDHAAARAHYLSVCRIYRGRLLDSEGAEPWFHAERAMYDEMIAVASARGSDIRSPEAVVSSRSNVRKGGLALSWV